MSEKLAAEAEIVRLTDMCDCSLAGQHAGITGQIETLPDHPCRSAPRLNPS